ncbi:MAG: glycosyltransferase [Lachnospiraceae bacterium]|nr:glycosyltransferase [Lachnospiraceae bacterium]
MAKTKVSVVIPAHNAENYIVQALDSVVNQTLEDEIEIIVVNDASTDRTVDVTEEYARKTITAELANRSLVIINNEENKGVAESRNIGIAVATGEYIAFLDADDWWDETKLEKQLNVFAVSNDKNTKIVFTARGLFDFNGNPLGKIIETPEYTDYKHMLKTNSINCSSAIMKAEIAKSVKMDYPEYAEDYIYWLRILKDGGVAVGINEPLLKYRMSKTSKSGNKLHAAKMHFGAYRVIGVPLYKAIYYFMCYALEGVRKYS